MVELDVFPRGDVSLAQRGVLLRNFSQAVQHIRRSNSAGEFDAYHLDIGLALTVDTLPQPEGRKNGVVQLADAEPVYLGIKALDFVLHERNDGRRILRQLQTGFMDFVQVGNVRYAGQDVLLRVGAQKSPPMPTGKLGGRRLRA